MKMRICQVYISHSRIAFAILRSVIIRDNKSRVLILLSSNYSKKADKATLKIILFENFESSVRGNFSQHPLAPSL